MRDLEGTFGTAPFSGDAKVERIGALMRAALGDADLDEGILRWRRLVGIDAMGTPEEAELAKLFTNTWRYMKFAMANQFFTIAQDAGADYTRILAAIKTDYPRAKDLPGPGFAAGPCLLKDTMQLAAFTPDHFPLGHSAMQVNEGMPAWVVSTMEARYGSLEGRSIALLGMAFKAEIDDTRASLSYKLKNELMSHAREVLTTDPYVTTDPTLLPLDEVIARSDVLIVCTPHRSYKAADLKGKPVVDVWGLLENANVV